MAINMIAAHISLVKNGGRGAWGRRSGDLTRAGPRGQQRNRKQHLQRDL
jgi:hypothetical protein